ncbi:nuclear transport factor 2 family protein [Aquiflexum gelatinilyticum]|uniref:Nuclear transport factor 2 family protein n=1 Tax=Aquiflexum gelatinilyticum TaxID=2961943 RepID=A0A9X2P622_9BACT|nr:nuclear transport factor 2 family protein [Aquiflexum gelatinilyticum]MCR9017019.1 nuclear transport factor 2 family protein [Aquiflexum gelatinilyticum]MCS4434760.1 nuclear transport factor 2 family protein [Aquiflexum gelatinilyticum]
MKKQIFLYFLILFLGLRNESSAQSAEEQNVSKSIDRLVVAMIAADREMLNPLLSDALHYGHSSGLVQDKSGFVDEVVSKSPLSYISIDREKEVIHLSKKTATVSHILTIKGKNPAGDPVNIRIGNMMVWEKEKSGWKLLARQAYKL